MKLFLDSCDAKEILQACDWGVLDGVTTNHSVLIKGGPDMQATLRRVVDASPGPVLCQVIGFDNKVEMMRQARWLFGFSEKIIVKLPIGPAGLQALRDLKKERPDRQIAITVVSSVAQAYLCGKMGADIVALFNGPMELEIEQDVDLVTPVRKVFDNYGFKTKILSCGRFPRAFGEFAAAGTDICTMKFEYLKLLYEHPYTEKRMAGFARDWRSVFGDKTWPGLDA
jgi:transaldolase